MLEIYLNDLNIKQCLKLFNANIIHNDYFNFTSKIFPVNMSILYFKINNLNHIFRLTTFNIKLLEEGGGVQKQNKNKTNPEVSECHYIYDLL